MLGLITTQFELLVAVKRAIGYNKLRRNGDLAAAKKRQEAVRKTQSAAVWRHRNDNRVGTYGGAGE